MLTLIRDERDFQVRLDYIHYNPVKHGLVACPADWPHSTFLAWVEKDVYDPRWGSDEPPPLPEHTYPLNSGRLLN